MIKVGNVHLRYYVILGADHLRRFNLDYQAYYWRKYQETTKHQHKRALVLTVHKLVSLMQALLTKNVPCVRPEARLHSLEDEPLPQLTRCVAQPYRGLPTVPQETHVFRRSLFVPLVLTHLAAGSLFGCQRAS